MNRFKTLLLSAALAVSGCQAVSTLMVKPRLAIGLPESLAHPVKQDWLSDRITSARLMKDRKAFFDSQRQLAPKTSSFNLQAFPTAGPGWPFAVGGGDWVSASPATTFFGSQVPTQVQNMVFCLTKGGKLFRISKSNPSSYTSVTMSPGPFTRTFITLSPSCSRAYCLDDTARLHIIDTINMVEEPGSPIAIHGAGGGAGIAPALDPVASDYTDRRDVLYIPTNDGFVTRLIIKTGATTGTFVATGNTLTQGVDLWDVASTASPPAPLFGSVKIAAPGVAYGNHFYVGDQDGVVHDLDVLANTIDDYDVGQTDSYADAIDSAPALEIWDSTSYPSPTNYTAPANGEPAFLFVNSGRTCSWVNLIDNTITNSQDLWVDDNDRGRAQNSADYLLRYNYSDTTNDVNATYVGGGNMDLSDTTVLPGSTNFRSTSYISPASDDGVTGSRKKVVSYMRWQFSTTTNSSYTGAFLTSAKMSLRSYMPSGTTQYSPVISALATSPYYNGTTSLWTFGNLTNAAGATQAPTRDATTYGRYTSTIRNGLARYGGGEAWYNWNVTKLFQNNPVSTTVGTSTSTPYNFAVALDQPTASVMYPGASNSGTFTAQRFYNLSDSSRYPKLRLRFVKYTNSPKDIRIASPPVIDPLHGKVYVVNCNQVFALDYNYNDPTTFEDSQYDPLNGGTRYTLFTRTTEGDNNQTIYGGTYNSRKSFILNMTAPLLSYDANSLYAISVMANPQSTAAPTTWNVSLSKLSILALISANSSDPLDTSNGQPRVTSLTSQTVGWMKNSSIVYPYLSSTYMALDPYSNATTTGGGVYFGLANGNLYYITP